MICLQRFATLLCCGLTAYGASACTSAIISARLNPDGRPLLWKHRDTGNPDGKVEYIPASEGRYAYVALFNASDTQCREAWTGMNSVGFAIMNTASYNIKDDDVPERDMDREGLVMAMALESCRSVDDFARLLDGLPRPMGVEANFGVIDASGEGAYFETNNHSYVRFDLADAPEGYLVRTNYSHSGRKDEGLGYIREANAQRLIAPAAAECGVTAEYLTESVSRSFWHDLMQKDFSLPDATWVVDQDFIPRYTSTATIVIEGARPGLSADDAEPGLLAGEYIMWTGLGYPPCAEIVPVMCKPDGVSQELRASGADGHSPMSDKVKARRDSVFSIHRGSGNRYIEMSRLFNADGTGYVQTLTPQNRQVYETVRRWRDGR